MTPPAKEGNLEVLTKESLTQFRAELPKFAKIKNKSPVLMPQHGGRMHARGGFMHARGGFMHQRGGFMHQRRRFMHARGRFMHARRRLSDG